MGVAEGNTVELDRVLLISDDDKLTVGTPNIEGAKVLATSQGENRGKKIIVLKYKPKDRYRKKTGHRQNYTRLVIDKIIESGEGAEEPVKRTRRSKSEVTESGS